MTRGYIFATLSLLLLSCERPQPALSDADVELFRRELPGITNECLDKLGYGGIDAVPARVDQCFEMAPARHWRGLWRDDFEGSVFCPQATQECSFDTLDQRIWLTFQAPARRPVDAYGGLYAVEFIGRRTAKAGQHGHLGSASHELVVDHLLSFREVESAAEGTAKAAAAWKRCETAGKCMSSNWSENTQRD